MQTKEIAGLNYLLSSNQQSPYNLSNYNMIQNNIPTFQYQTYSNQLLNYQNTPLDFNSPQSSCISSNSTSDEADEQQLSLINERKHRRMISNRESARRSRMRKQKHLDELWSQVLWLRNENQQLMDKLNHATENQDQVLQENSKLKEEVSELRQMLRDMQIHSPLPCFSSLLEEDVHVPCSSAYLNSDSSNQSISTSSMDLLG